MILPEMAFTLIFFPSIYPEGCPYTILKDEDEEDFLITYKKYIWKKYSIAIKPQICLHKWFIKTNNTACKNKCKYELFAENNWTIFF